MTNSRDLTSEQQPSAGAAVVRNVIRRALERDVRAQERETRAANRDAAADRRAAEAPPGFDHHAAAKRDRNLAAIDREHAARDRDAAVVDRADLADTVTTPPQGNSR